MRSPDSRLIVLVRAGQTITRKSATAHSFEALCGIKGTMKQLAKQIWIFILIIGFSTNLRASNILTTDSIKITQIVNGFYDWYLTSIKEKKYSDFMPKFVESENGMTTLDYSTYLENLKTHGFSDSLILKEKRSYSVCIENLGKVKFSEFEKTTFTDLDDFEQANCDFGNYYRWIGGLEPVDGIRIKNIKFISEDSTVVSIEYFDIENKLNKKYYRGENSLTLIRLNNKWFIDRIDSWNNN